MVLSWHVYCITMSRYIGRYVQLYVTQRKSRLGQFKFNFQQLYTPTKIIYNYNFRCSRIRTYTCLANDTPIPSLHNINP